MIKILSLGDFRDFERYYLQFTNYYDFLNFVVTKFPIIIIAPSIRPFWLSSAVYALSRRVFIRKSFSHFYPTAQNNTHHPNMSNVQPPYMRPSNFRGKSQFTSHLFRLTIYSTIRTHIYTRHNMCTSSNIRRQDTFHFHKGISFFAFHCCYVAASLSPYYMPIHAYNSNSTHLSIFWEKIISIHYQRDLIENGSDTMMVTMHVEKKVKALLLLMLLWMDMSSSSSS